MDLSSAGFECIARHVKDACGLVLPEEKAYLLRQRLEPGAAAHGCRCLDELAMEPRRSERPDLRRDIVSAITTQETSFFRDEHPWEVLRDRVLPVLARSPREDAPLRCLAAGVATGQEAYTLAMVAAEARDRARDADARRMEVRIVATDISERALAVAREGVYAGFQLTRGLSAERRDRFFTSDAGGYRVCAALRRSVDFHETNLATEFQGFGRFDLILCRNVLIYFDAETKRKAFDRFHDLLQPWGRLLLGSTESTYHVTDRFASERFGKTILYRRRDAEPLPAPPPARTSARLRPLSGADGRDGTSET